MITVLRCGYLDLPGAGYGEGGIVFAAQNSGAAQHVEGDRLSGRAAGGKGIQVERALAKGSGGAVEGDALIQPVTLRDQQVPGPEYGAVLPFQEDEVLGTVLVQIRRDRGVVHIAEPRILHLDRKSRHRPVMSDYPECTAVIDQDAGLSVSGNVGDGGVADGIERHREELEGPCMGNAVQLAACPAHQLRAAIQIQVSLRQLRKGRKALSAARVARSSCLSAETMYRSLKRL